MEKELTKTKEESMITKAAMETLGNALKNDSEYAWSWNCNIAMASYDEGLSLKKSNKAAARFMYNAFKVDTTKNKHFKKTQD